MENLKAESKGKGKKKVTRADSLEVRARAGRKVFEPPPQYETPWAPIQSIAPKIGGTAETLRIGVRRAETDRG
jgi:transposase